jgi:hypothetical protein
MLVIKLELGGNWARNKKSEKGRKRKERMAGNFLKKLTIQRVSFNY